MEKNGTKKCGFAIHAEKNGSSNRAPYGHWKCDRCNLVFETRDQLQEHNHEFHPILKGSSWNKGLTKETDSRVAKTVETCKARGKYVSWCKGKHLSKEHRNKVSRTMKTLFKEHPELAPYVRNHHSKGESYPEKYFRELFISEQIIGWKQDLPKLGYFLDFGFEAQKIDFEVDGSQHSVDARIIKHDIERTAKLEANGWKVIRINWSEWQSQNDASHRQWVLWFKQQL